MSKLQNPREPYSKSSSYIEDGYTTGSFGWEIKDNGISDKELKNIEKDLINKANKNINLKNVFDIYHISFFTTYSPSGWTHKCSCPLPEHKDNTPSFCFNPDENRFNCFGCSKGGGPVQFYSLMNKTSAVEAARVLLKNSNLLDTIINEIRDTQDEEIDKLLLSFSNSINHLIKSSKNKNVLQFAESLTWSLDVYLEKHIPRRSLNLDNLSVRINLLLGKINKYE